MIDTLGELIDRLEKLSKKYPADTMVSFTSKDTNLDWSVEFGSWRGSYSDICLFLDHYQETNRHNDVNLNNNTTLGTFLKIAKSQDGKVHYGYKGGEYEMSRDTELRVDRSDLSSDLKIKNIKMNEDGVIMVKAKNYEDYRSTRSVLTAMGHFASQFR